MHAGHVSAVPPVLVSAISAQAETVRTGREVRDALKVQKARTAATMLPRRPELLAQERKKLN